MSEDKQAEEALRDTRLMLNHGDRIDWVLQDDMNMMGGVGEVGYGTRTAFCMEKLVPTQKPLAVSTAFEASNTYRHYTHTAQ